MSGDVHVRFCERPGVRFPRATQRNVYVRSERAGKRVMDSVTRFIERRLRLEINRDTVLLPVGSCPRTEERPKDRRHSIGFHLRYQPLDGSCQVLLSKRSKLRIDKRIVELTPRNWGGSLRACIDQVNGYLRGWFAFFAIFSPEALSTFASLDAHLRRRLRAIQLRHWKRCRTIVKRLIALGARRKTAWRRVYQGRKSLWALSHDSVVDRALRNAYFARRGLISLRDLLRDALRPIAAPAQLTLPLG